MFPNVVFERYSRQDGLKILLQRFAYCMVWFEGEMAKSYLKKPTKEIRMALESLIEEGCLIEYENGYVLQSDFELLKASSDEPPKSVFAMHRNDFLVKSNEHWLKDKYVHPYPDTLYYLLIDGVFQGAVIGKFRYTPHVEDVILDLPDDEVVARKSEILQAIHVLCGTNNPVKRYQGVE